MSVRVAIHLDRTINESWKFNKETEFQVSHVSSYLFTDLLYPHCLPKNPVYTPPCAVVP